MEEPETTEQTETQQDHARIKAIREHIKAFVKAKMQYMKLAVYEEVALTTAEVSLGFMMLLFSLFFMIFLSTGAALWLNTVMDSRFAGFFMVAGIYLLLIILFFVLRNQLIINPITNIIVRKLANKREKDGKKDK